MSETPKDYTDANGVLVVHVDLSKPFDYEAAKLDGTLVPGSDGVWRFRDDAQREAASEESELAHEWSELEKHDGIENPRKK